MLTSIMFWLILSLDSIKIDFIRISTDPFGDAQRESKDGGSGQSEVIHIRIQQRNGRKTLTTVQGISDDYDKKRLAKACKKVWVHGFIKELIFKLV